MVAAHLLEQRATCERIGHFDAGSLQGLESFSTPDRKHWYITKAHEGSRLFHQALKTGHALALYSYRDPRDVVFSLAHKFGYSFEEMFRRGMYHQVRLNHQFWKRQPGLLLQRYEDITQRPSEAVLQIGAHLGLNVTADAAEATANLFSIEKNKERTAQVAQRLVEHGANLSERTFLIADDQHTLLQWNHIRQGKVGGWREEATAEQISHLAKLYGPMLIELGYEQNFHWVEPALEAALQRETASASSSWNTPTTRQKPAAVSQLRWTDYWKGWACCQMRLWAYQYPKTRVLCRKILDTNPLTRLLLQRYRQTTRLVDTPPIRENLAEQEHPAGPPTLGFVHKAA